MSTFPASLPAPTVDEYTLQPVDAVIRTDMDIGAPRARRRTRARLDRLRLKWMLDDAQMLVFRAWHESWLEASAGAAWTWMTLAFGDGGLRSREVRFVGPWSARPLHGGLLWEVTADAEARGGELTIDQLRGAVAGYVFDNVYPTLYLDFAADKTLDSRISFTRDSTATYIGADGKYYTAAAHVARFTHDEMSLASRGLLVEPQATNRALWSDDFGNAAWTKTGCTVTSNAVASPMSGVNADLITEDTSTGAHGIFQAVSGLADNAVVVASFFVRPAGRTVVQLAVVRKDGAEHWAFFTCTGAGSVSNISGTLAQRISQRADGWYRCSIVVNLASGASTPVIRLRLASAPGTMSYTGDGASGAYVWQGQLEDPFTRNATSPILTTSAAVTRSGDAPVMSGANLTSWYNAAQGTLLVIGATDALYAGTAINHVMAVLSDNTANQRITICRLVGPSFTEARCEVMSGGTQQASFQSGQDETGKDKWCVSYAANNFAFYGRGALIGTDTSGSVPAVDRLQIGFGSAGFARLGGAVARIVYWPVVLTQEHGKAITA